MVLARYVADIPPPTIEFSYSNPFKTFRYYAQKWNHICYTYTMESTKEQLINDIQIYLIVTMD